MRAVLLLAAFGSVMIGCGIKESPDTVDRDAALYEAAVAHLIQTSEVELIPDWANPFVFIEVLEAESIDLETQVAVVDGFEADYRIRFVDELDEAVDMDMPGFPVEEGTVLLALGPIEADGSEFVLHAEFYLDAITTGAFEYRFQHGLTSAAGSPTMVGDPTPAATKLDVTES